MLFAVELSMLGLQGRQLIDFTALMTLDLDKLRQGYVGRVEG